ncbi:ATP-binding cassette sub-family G member 1-like [Daktulosphaira vitifoliae]|uniref:ATP-binding cassette sub-family G member 1-like n=1 Tax=Daktulosphaira vitifoliae TaxID=58002 RepID=UPI0021AA3C34|nr:ATP-binding cassette sub-family G member 1-like [Daktulosphaira vitifoliae]XP_050539803.1 ATP-binding cassette sub-family G member 1-like [Daktulosphaira vitifoliae]
MTSAPRMVLMHLPQNQPMDITFKDVIYSVNIGYFKKETKHILRGISGRFNCGELTAIMGPSGAGKSSLLNILTGFQRNGVEGLIKTTKIQDDNISNNSDLTETVGNIMCRKESCYIMQDDQLCPLFTVLEIMMMAADLKLGYTLSYKSKLLVIEDILDSMGLASSIHTKCGRLSGGQKKRLSIALELIDNPPIMFLDEPTTGLDSTSSHQCISVLKGLARGGRTVVCTIHQPSASTFEMFDHVYIMSEGFCVYQGSSLNIVPYLQTIGLNCPQYHNPADFIMEVVTGEYGHYTSQLKIAASDNSWRTQRQIMSSDLKVEKINKTQLTTTLVLVNQPTELNKLLILIHRFLLQLYRDWTVTHVKLCMHFLVGVLLGLLFENAGVDGGKTINNIGFFIVSLVYLSYTSIMPAILKFPAEIHILKKELFNNWYKLPTYFVAFLLTNLPIQMMFCFIYTSVAYYLTSQLLTWTRFSMFLFICQLMTLISEGIGLILGTAMSPVNGVFIGSIITCLCILFAGFLVLFNHMSAFLYYVSYSSYMRYALEGLVLSIYGYGRDPLRCFGDKEYCHYRFPETTFKEIGMTDGRFWIDVSSLSIYLIIILIISYVALRKNLKSSV